MIGIGGQMRNPKSTYGQFARNGMPDAPVPSTWQRHISCQFLFPETNPAHRKDTARYFGPYRRPGTAPIGLRKTRPDLFQDTLDDPIEPFPIWLERTILDLLSDMSTTRADQFSGLMAPADEKETVRRVAEILEWPAIEDQPLHMAIPQQMYEDVFIRILAYLHGQTGFAEEPHRYQYFNALCFRLGKVVLKMVEDRTAVYHRNNIDTLIRTAVLSGHIGINLKTSASAASALLNRNSLPLRPEWVANMSAVGDVKSAALRRSAEALFDLVESDEGQFGLESILRYQSEVIETNVPTLLVFFADDFLESMLDMKRFEWILARNPHLRLLFVPRAGRYGNDLAFDDVAGLLRLPELKTFGRLHKAGHIWISADGPRAGCIDPRDISARLIQRIDALSAGRQVIIETKGCRNFEMLQGALPVPWYAAFNCNRALSIRTVQVDGQPVFLRIPPYLKAYDGFESPRIGPSALYPSTGVRYAQMTTRDLYQALQKPSYQLQTPRWGNEKQVNIALTTSARRLKKTIPALLEHIDAGQLAMDGIMYNRKAQARRLSGSKGAVKTGYSRTSVRQTFRNVTFRRMILDGYQHFRSQKWVARKFGRQFSRSRRFVEIDLTYRCNLKCANCNRSCTQAPSRQEIFLNQIETFIRESIAAEANWERIRLLGGEPTLHSRFGDIVALLRDYRKNYRPNLHIVICSNGKGRRVNAMLNALPNDIDIKNTYKRSPDHLFRPFNMAPIDSRLFRWSDYAGGCRIIAECGLGLTPMGYYPCAIAGGIDRIFGLALGRKCLPPADDHMRDLMQVFCAFCGHFGFAWPTRRVKISPTWQAAYRRYDQKYRHAPA